MKLWQENRITKEYELSDKEIAEKFIRSNYNTSEFREYYNLQYLIALFIASKDGLNSAFEDDTDGVYNEIRKIEDEAKQCQ